MGSNSTNDVSLSAKVAGLEAPIEIKIKTLDSQTYTLQVHKQMPVPELKQQIASVTGVLSDRQRLICRGRVLKDDQLLSAYHIEDGHTLHLVVGQPGPPPSTNSAQQTAAESGANASNGQRIQVAPGVVVETYDITDPGDGALPDINRIVSAVLGAFGGRNSGGSERMTNGQPEQTNVSGEPGVRGGFGSGQTMSLGSFLQSRVIPDSLTTLTQYLDHMRQEYIANEGNTNNGDDANGNQRRGSNFTQVQEDRLPTPEMLAEVLLSARNFLTTETAQSLLQFGTELQNHSNIREHALRLETQASAWRNGTLLQNLGAFLLELGRATMTLRMGSPSEAVVNAGPAVFISESGPNPLMVQPLPFQPGAPFGLANGGQPPSINDAAAGAFVPRRIDIQIRRGSSSIIRDSNNNEEEREGSQVRHVPIRTMFAIPSGRLPGLNNLRPGGFRAFPSGPQQPESGAQPTAVDPVRELNNATIAPAAAESGLQQGPSRRFRFSVLSSGPAENHQPPGREVPSEVFQVLRSLFPGGEIHVEDLAFAQPTTTTEAAVTATTAVAAAAPLPPPPAEGTTNNAGGTTQTEQEPVRATEDGIFLSNFLREIMPVISQVTDTSTQAQDNTAGTSRRSSDDHENAPDSKRQKTE
jgi:uncharacterized ubiquitin-like protein YukD